MKKIPSSNVKKTVSKHQIRKMLRFKERNTYKNTRNIKKNKLIKEKKIPSAHNNRNSKHTEQRPIIKSCKGKY